MENLLHKRVRAAAIAGWWTLLVAVGLHLVLLSAVMLTLHCRPGWIPAMMGGVPWETVQLMALGMIALYRVLVWTMFLVVIWLTIWSAKLKAIA